jgi:hypothetical protein
MSKNGFWGKNTGVVTDPRQLMNSPSNPPGIQLGHAPTKLADILQMANMYGVQTSDKKEQEMTNWLKKQHEPEEKKPSNILRNLFWLGVAAAILAAFML